MDTLKQPVEPGDTCIVYIDTQTACVGLIVGIDDDRAKILQLGYMQDEPKHGPSDVLAPPAVSPFPTYTLAVLSDVVPYTFGMEILLCKQRNNNWWQNETNRPCFPNLIARHFRPQHLRELQYIDAAQHFMRGRAIEDFRSFGARIGDHALLLMWATLYTWFPSNVQKPPETWQPKTANYLFRINLNGTENPPVILTERT